MEDGRKTRDPFGLFGVGSFGGFGGSAFGRNLFEESFFACPFDSLFDENNHVLESFPAHPQNEPIIRELGSDDEEDVENKELGENSASNNSEPVVNHPDDEPDDSSKQTNRGTNYSSMQQAFKVHSSKVSYGGIDGVYYTSSATRKTRNDGVVMEECKETDKRTGEAAHRISRGLHDKGHSVTRKLYSDGKVDTLQTLHNLNEDELGSFEEAWNGNFRRQLPLQTGSSSNGVGQMSNWGIPQIQATTRYGPSNVNRGNRSSGRPSNMVRIHID